MCFSAGASFTASAILGAGGLIALTKSKFDKQSMFAAVPLIFSIQQLCEGFLWEAIHGNNLTAQDSCTYLFLVFAQVVWPTWLPLSVLKMEEDPKRKRILRYVLFAGVLASLMLGLRMLFSTITSQANHHHIHYEIQSPQWIGIISSILYFIATIFPSFISAKKGMKALAAILLVSLLVSVFFFRDDLISVWCYFGAIASIIIIFVVKRPRLLVDVQPVV